jgi:hypothetical protein
MAQKNTLFLRLKKNLFYSYEMSMLGKGIGLLFHYISLPIKVFLGFFGLAIPRRDVFTHYSDILSLQHIKKDINENNPNSLEGSLRRYIQAKYICRKFSRLDGFDASEANGQMLSYFAYAVLKLKTHFTKTNEATGVEDFYTSDIQDKFEYFMVRFVQSNFCLLQGTRPVDEDMGQIYDAFLEDSNYIPVEVKMKTSDGSFYPHLFLSSSNALFLLAALKVYGKKLRCEEGLKLYRKFFWVYGYGLLALFSPPDEEGAKGVALTTLIECSTGFDKRFWEFAQYLYKKQVYER